MLIDVALTPALIRESATIFAVVDTLRASSTIVTLLERGVPEIVPAASVEEARQLRSRLPGHLLCGESGGLPPEGFDYGNSPAEFATLTLDGPPAILATSNGTRILNQLADAQTGARPGAAAVIVGAPLNREATAKALSSLAAEHGEIAIICAAAPSGVPALEDALGAGAIVEAALRLDSALEPTDAAHLARDAFLTARGDLARALAFGRHGAELIAGGFAEDVEHCARLDASKVVPRLDRRDDGLLALRSRP